MVSYSPRPEKNFSMLFPKNNFFPPRPGFEVAPFPHSARSSARLIPPRRRRRFPARARARRRCPLLLLAAV